LLEDILSAEATLKNAVKRHKQSHETLNIRKMIQKQLSYDKYQNLKQDLQTLENNINSLNQNLDHDMERLNQLSNQATSSSLNNSAISNDKKNIEEDLCKIRHTEISIREANRQDDGDLRSHRSKDND